MYKEWVKKTPSTTEMLRELWKMLFNKVLDDVLENYSQADN